MGSSSAAPGPAIDDGSNRTDAGIVTPAPSIQIPRKGLHEFHFDAPWRAEKRGKVPCQKPECQMTANGVEALDLVEEQKRSLTGRLCAPNIQSELLDIEPQLGLAVSSPRPSAGWRKRSRTLTESSMTREGGSQRQYDVRCCTREGWACQSSVRRSERSRATSCAFAAPDPAPNIHS